MSLTTVAASARKVVKFGGLFLVILPIFIGIVSSSIKAYKKANPIKKEPNVKYGIIPKIEFPDKKIETKNIALELVNDKLPNLGDQARVYVVFRTDKNFLALETETQTAKELGFDSEPRLISPNTYEFSNNNNQKLIMNILDGSFRLKYPYNEDQMLMTNYNMPNKDELIAKAKNFLDQAKKLPTDIKNADPKVSYWKNDGSGLKQVSSQSEANMARVDFYRDAVYGDIKIMSTDINRAPISVLISGSNISGKDIVDIEYKYVNIDRESYATYPIKSTEEAYSDLKNSKYWPVSDTTENDITIRKVYLAYFEPAVLTNFMEPIYVFEGDSKSGSKFIAYVSAVVDKYTK